MHSVILLSLLFGLWVTIIGAASNDSTQAINLGWLGSAPKLNLGTTFGLPWQQGQLYPNSTRFEPTQDGILLQSWINAYWQDGSIKWTGHALSATEDISETLTIKAIAGSTKPTPGAAEGLKVDIHQDMITVNTGKLVVSFATKGKVLIPAIKTASGKVVGKDGRLILTTLGVIPDEPRIGANQSTASQTFQGEIEKVSVSDGEHSSVRVVVTVHGKHRADHNPDQLTNIWLPFVVRFYLYYNSEAIKMMHSIIYDGEPSEQAITSLGVRFQIPLGDEEAWNRHIRFTSSQGGVLHESPQGITGNRRDPGDGIRDSQIRGQQLPALDKWSERVSSVIQWIPKWNDYSLSQLSPDGFTLKKRTAAGQSWINIPAGDRAGGLVYLGGATKGGLALAQRYFWQRYPTGIDVRNAASDSGEVTLWLYSPDSPPMDMRPYHDGLGLDTWEKQISAIEATYEDYEPGFNTPYGVARTNELYIYGFDSTPEATRLSELSKYAEAPPVLVPDREHVSRTKALGSYWKPTSQTADSEAVAKLESQLQTLVEFFSDQIKQRKWYGFWDHGDIMHNYDNWRHTWRYDIGGYAWDNSELSPDLFFWQYFLRTGNEKAYRLAETMTRHTGEVDVYHLGQWKGLGSRHNVQHWGDSAKQARIATAQYRKYFYYLTGGDERTGELIEETLHAEKTFITLDPQRKVRVDGFKPSPTAVGIELGIDFGSMAASWLLEYERRGPSWKEARDKLNSTMSSIAALKNGFVTGAAIYNPSTGEIMPPLTDKENNGVVDISHLGGVFGLIEVMSELLEYWVDDLPKGFDIAWREYCYYYGASGDEQKSRYGAAFKGVSLRQAHSRLVAYLAHHSGNETLAARAWDEFYNFKDSEGIRQDADWNITRVEEPSVLFPVDEATWLTTNTAMQYGLAAIQNLAWAGFPPT